MTNCTNKVTYDEHGQAVWPVRHRDESPIDYYKRTRAVDARYYHAHEGRYYCNPAHCMRSWDNKEERDAHLKAAYAILD
jgi:hypothetical protein